MTIAPIWKTCQKCHKKYDWNPDIGHFKCPYCYGLGKASKDKIGIFFKKEEKKNAE